ncbi:MAG: hypothetical protein E7381_01455 [Clostridiales bacterium]|nr:hypothetical protein [Clostridiales bacterium]
MKFCNKCGRKNFDTATYCERCGNFLRLNEIVTQKQSKCSKVASIFMVISCVVLGICSMVLEIFSIILWDGLNEISNDIGVVEMKIMWIVLVVAVLIGFIISIFATHKYIKDVKSGKKIGTGFKVCVLLFVNIIAGILMLCDEDEMLVKVNDIRMSNK